jgi:hypothetical protein
VSSGDGQQKKEESYLRWAPPFLLRLTRYSLPKKASGKPLKWCKNATPPKSEYIWPIVRHCRGRFLRNVETKIVAVPRARRCVSMRPRGMSTCQWLSDPINTPCYRHNSPTTTAMLPPLQPHQSHDALLLLRLRAHGWMKECQGLVALHEVHRPRSFGRRTASFRIAPRRPCQYNHAYSSHDDEI